MQTGGESGSAMADINVTPLVDVMLVLLIIFMIVTPALLAGFQATLPTGINLKERPDDDQRVTLGIDAQGNYYLNRKPIPKEMAPSILQAAFNERPQDKVLFLKAHNQLEYGVILEAMEIGRNAGAVVMAAVSERTPGASAAKTTACTGALC
jgi:biopolymer transport protein TolR